MPELPEVETIVNDLNLKLKELIIQDFKVVNELIPRSRSMLNLAEKVFKREIFEQEIVAVQRVAKNIVITIGGKYLVIHLKMTGQLVYEASAAKGSELIVGGHPIVGIGSVLPNKFTRAIFTFNDESKLYFNDIRRFGWIRLMTQTEFAEYKQTLGIEPFSLDYNLKNFKAVLEHKKNTTIKQAILEQKYLVGVGNIYADESLFEAGIKPMRLTKTLSEVEIKKLMQAILRVFKLAIKHRGTSFSDYRDASGKKGNFVKYLKVYGRVGQPCRRCSGIVQKTKVGGRGTHWCELCQK